jgi:membrane protease YdiL (CAAX protease family)
MATLQQTSFRAFIKKHPVLTYYALAFALSWGFILIVIGPDGFLGTMPIPAALMPLLYPATLAGPALAGLLLTGIIYGRAGLRELLSRLLRWRVGARWYAVALLSAPLLMAATIFALSLTSPAFLPVISTSADKASRLLIGLAVGLVVGFFEELGWTGFATPELRKRYGMLATGLIMGLLWGAWHFPLFSGRASSSGVPSALWLTVLLFSFLPPYRVLMVWVYDRTHSLLVVMLMHAPLVAGQFTLIPAATGLVDVIFDLVFAAALWVVVAAVVVVNRGKLSRGENTSATPFTNPL